MNVDYLPLLLYIIVVSDGTVCFQAFQLWHMVWVRGCWSRWQKKCTHQKERSRSSSSTRSSQGPLTESPLVSANSILLMLTPESRMSAPWLLITSCAFVVEDHALSCCCFFPLSNIGLWLGVLVICALLGCDKWLWTFGQLFLKFRRHRNFIDLLCSQCELSAVFCSAIELIIAATVAVVIYSLTLFRHILLNSTLFFIESSFYTREVQFYWYPGRRIFNPFLKSSLYTSEAQFYPYPVPSDFNPFFF